ncbi:MAG: T9SS type A sorting domain-containing protein [Bacteroidales bacterium]|nr:T9SS type A sorting domain-containing protein [Bacteroidales bacterium]
MTYEVPVTGPVRLSVFSSEGREILVPVNENRQKGTHEIILDARDLPAGIFYVRLQAGAHSQTKRMIRINDGKQ